MEPDVSTGALARIDALHRGLTRVVLEGGGLDAVAGEVARVLEVGVLVTSTDGRERAAALPAELRARLVEVDLVTASGRVRVERMEGRQGAGAPVGGGEARGVRVVAGEHELARLVAVRAEGPLAPDDLALLERAADLTALLVTRLDAVAEVEHKYAGDFLRDVFLGRAGDEQFVSEHAASLGWRLAGPTVVLVAEIDPAAGGDAAVDRGEWRRWQQRFAAAWRQVLRGLDAGVPVVDLSHEVVVLVPLAEPGAASELLPGEDVVRRVVAAVAGDKGGGRRPFSVGVSRPAPGLGDLPAAYAQARRAVDVGRRVRGGGSTTFFDQLGLHRLIAMVPDTAELRAFADDVLGPLAGDTTEAVDLRETLQVLLDTNFNVAEAARTQFFHYNTMRYRVSKLERLLGPLSSDPHLRLDVAVALRVLDVAG